MTVPRASTVYVIAAASFLGKNSAARVAALLDLSHREWAWLPDPDGRCVRVYRLMTPEELTALTAARWAGEADSE